MNGVDIVLIIALLIGFVRGFSSGIIRQIAGIIGVVLSLLFALHLMGPMGDQLSVATGWSVGITSVLAFILIFVAIQIGMFFAARLIEGLVGVLQLTILNRIAGAIFGGFKAALLASVVLITLAVFDLPDTSARRGSILYEPVASLVPEAWDVAARHLPAVKQFSSEFGSSIEALVE